MKNIIGFLVFLYGCGFIVFNQVHWLLGNRDGWLDRFCVAVLCILVGLIAMHFADLEKTE